MVKAGLAGVLIRFPSSGRWFQGLFQRIVIRRAVIPCSMNKKAGRAVDAASNAAGAVFFDPFGDDALFEGPREFVQIQSRLLGPDRQDVRLQISLVFVNE